MLQNKVRIISGKWKGTKIDFPENSPARPTIDRARESIFNYLQGHLPNANCLDLFAGTGVFGFEALSRGAKKATLIEVDKATCDRIIKNKQKLKAENCLIKNTGYDSFLKANTEKFDIVFLDPPYNFKKWHELIKHITTSKLINSNGLIITEWSQEQNIIKDYLTEIRSFRFGIATIKIWEPK